VGVIRALATVAVLALTAAAVRAGQPVAASGAGTIWDGVYTEAQAERGAYVYPAICGRCHGYKLDGAPDDPDMLPTPPLAGPKFLRKWSGASLAVLFEYTRQTMPAINPGSLSDQEFADVVAYTLAVSGAPAGPEELEPAIEPLARVTIGPAP
jgi:mono/diheme cytochrome c family protein